jgi:hypothetical protein
LNFCLKSRHIKIMSFLHLSPVHLHLALNHVPIIGLAVATFPIFIGLLAQSRTTVATGLLATLLCTSVMPTIMDSGHEAYLTFKSGGAQPPIDAAGKIALKMHATRARQTAPIMYATAILALLCLLALPKFFTPARWLALAVLLGNTITVGMSVWTADAGGRVRHQELRPVTPWQETGSPASPTPVASPAQPLPATTAEPTAAPSEQTTMKSTASNDPTVSPPLQEKGKKKDFSSDLAHEDPEAQP